MTIELIGRVVFIACLAVGNLSLAGKSDSTEIDVLEIAGKSQQDVEILLGIPQSCKKSYLGESCRFKGGRMDIEFINGKADWIGIGFQAVDVDFDYRSISHIGLIQVRAFTPTY